MNTDAALVPVPSGRAASGGGAVPEPPQASVKSKSSFESVDDVLDVYSSKARAGPITVRDKAVIIIKGNIYLAIFIGCFLHDG